MIGSTAACARGRARPRSRPCIRASRVDSGDVTQGDALGGTKGEPEDAEMRRDSRVIPVRGVVGSVIYYAGSVLGPAGWRLAVCREPLARSAAGVPAAGAARRTGRRRDRSAPEDATSA